MKEFFTQCMKDLYALTGIEQVTWMLRDVSKVDPKDPNSITNGERNFDLCVEGMVVKSKEFAYIPEADQRRIISQMMVSDSKYDALNSRTIHQWLSLYKEKYFIDSQAPEDQPRIKLSDKEKARIDNLANSFKAQLAQGFSKPTYNRLAEEMSKLKIEDSERVEGKRGLLAGYLRNLKKFICDGIEIPAVDEDSARKQYKEAFGRDPKKCEPADQKQL